MEYEKVAILVDGGFYQRMANAIWGPRSAKDRADELYRYCLFHLKHKVGRDDVYDSLYRLFYYDCPPAENTVFHPLQKKNINLKKTSLFAFMTDFHKELLKKRKVALRLGKLSNNDLYYAMTPEAQKKLLSGTLQTNQLTDADFRLNIVQKGVDMRIGIDIASLAYKKQVTRIILLSGDSDFVPAAKLARREGIDFVLDSMGRKISEDLSEHIDGLNTHIKHDPLAGRTQGAGQTAPAAAAAPSAPST